MADRRQTSLEEQRVEPSTGQVSVIPHNRVFDHALLTRSGERDSVHNRDQELEAQSMVTLFPDPREWSQEEGHSLEPYVPPEP